MKLRKWLSISLAAMLLVAALPQPGSVVFASENPEAQENEEALKSEEAQENEESSEAETVLPDEEETESTESNEAVGAEESAEAVVEDMESTGPVDEESEDAQNDGTEWSIVTDEKLADATYSIFNISMDKNNNITITGLVNPNFSADIHLEIPSEINGNPVTAIGERAFRNNKNIKSVEFNEGLKVIGINAFGDCTNLVGEIVLPSSLTTLQEYHDEGAFRNTNITSVTVKGGSDKLKIGDNTFQECKMLESVKLSGRESEIGAYAFYGCPKLKTLYFPGGEVEKIIERNAFEGCAITELEIPGTVTSIGEAAFCNCLALKKLTLHEGLETIGSNAFNNCISLTGKLTLPASLKKIVGRFGQHEEGAFQKTALTEVEFLHANHELTIGERAFTSCEKLTKVTLPENVTFIDRYAFSNTPNLKTFTWASGNYDQEIGENAFINSGIVEMALPANVKYIGYNAFANCQYLRKLTLNEGLISIRDNAFANCIRLTGELIIPSTVTKIKIGAFQNTGFTSLLIKDGNNGLTIERDAFANCKLLESADLSNRLQSLGNNAFADDDYLVWVRIKSGNYELTIGYNVFQNTWGLRAIVLPKGLKSIQGDNFGQSDRLADVYYGGSADEHGKITIKRTNNEYYFKAEMHYNSVGPDQMPDLKREEFADYQGYTFYRDVEKEITCKDSDGLRVINDFKCDGTYTYYFQLNGTAMKDRLTYHPDGIHVIYFDAEGHEKFSDFANIKKTIAGADVDDMCFFNVYGYMYVDTLTYDKTGTKLYYVNPCGLLERNGWFEFSGKEFNAGLGFSGRAGGYGYANADFSLMTNTDTYWNGRLVHMQGDGHMFLD